MSLILATGTNIGDRLQNLAQAKRQLSSAFSLQEESRIYQSAAVDYEEQPDFYNQVLVFSDPKIEPNLLMTQVLELEAELGRTRDILRGPRIIDIDILFYNDIKSETDHLSLPHPRLFERSFVIRPLMELEVFKELNKKYDFNTKFDTEAYPLKL
ncbi:2-amino-4-hydroxy-6-hydroxymethyldihydropteridi ne pyrophosphokinase [Halobacteriovorax marinus SJ]|uniref:2-amino-4-hydroxy-6-hydroxymethyldihydropteridine pyrophosphokinase n=1 Tax=Halobacteriovorax marinus (strain ATCC BAA-682 / DSM 15412 / SJ) TaxID=862908 RepID=E1X168_HALMS|nr:2-amino-4-hydroxy-6-hydroxymethyldihydropteridine diphosphokinase [Halobacteriovorax marinus]CBW28138.1 2-amino-4-hydroxy-6-hydroxymethyldihydropteridi ne pyrophosphokinase [Halobacteriovorax marinus SJ]